MPESSAASLLSPIAMVYFPRVVLFSKRIIIIITAMVTNTEGGRPRKRFPRLKKFIFSGISYLIISCPGVTRNLAIP